MEEMGTQIRDGPLFDRITNAVYSIGLVFVGVGTY